MKSAVPDLSVVLPFSDDEDVIGTAARRLAGYLREQGSSFEIVAVDEDSGDNSRAVLGLLRQELPELRLVVAMARGRGLAMGAGVARGRVLLTLSPRTAATRPLAPVGRALRRVGRGELDIVAVGSHFAACHRTRSLPLIESLRGGTGFARRLARRGRSRQLRVESYELGGEGSSLGRVRTGLRARIVAVLSPARYA
jgi:hypothetical protein